MANPDGPDAGREWIEIFNASPWTLDPGRFSLTLRPLDAADERAAAIGTGSILPGEYVALGRLPAAGGADGVVRLAYGEELGALVNEGGRLTLRCGEVTLDEVQYAEMKDGLALGFDGSAVPDAVANDDPGRWCAAAREYAEGSTGTPNEPNEPCAQSAAARNAQCAQGDACPPTGVDEGCDKDHPCPSASPLTCLDGAQPRPVRPPAPDDLIITEIMADPGASADAQGEWFEIFVARSVDLNGVGAGPLSDPDRTLIQSDNCLPAKAERYLLFGRSEDGSLNGGLPPPDALFHFSLANPSGDVALSYGGIILDQVQYGPTAPGEATQLDRDRLTPEQSGEPGTWCAAGSPYGDGDLGTPAAPNVSCAMPPESLCEDEGGKRPVRRPRPGDLVITEIMADPLSVSDAHGEWFEVYVSSDIDLNGLEIGLDPEDPKVTLDAEACLSAEEGTYLVFARSSDSLVNGGLAAVNYLFNFALANSGSALSLGIGGELLDAATYSAATPGTATTLDPSHLDEEENNAAAAWCPATLVYGAALGGADLGSPGTANAACAGTTQTSCDDEGTPVPTIPPQPGDLVITEIMANPNVVTDTSGEWFEAYVTRTIHLNGIELSTEDGTVETTLASADCLEAPAGSRLVFARSTDSSVNGGLPKVDHLFNFSLVNANASLILGHGGAMLDRVTYSSPTAGASWALDPAHTDPTSNDAADSWCLSTTGYGQGDLGSPGAPNPACPPAGGSTCLDNGAPRPLVPPSIGDLVITEFMANPSAVTDSNGEWFEVYAASALDLNGLELGTTPPTVKATLSSTNCLHAEAGTHVVFSRSTDSNVNGGLPSVQHTFTFSILNSSGGLFVGFGGSVLDAISYTATTEGKSTQLDPDSTSESGNDDDDAWCPGTPSYGKGDAGTPGTPNAACP
ncbi:MAG: hypothetical protein HYY13_06370 [Nitrospirae bacterium]|nr:hypothetical protein [Nitrospirota bacterium]